MKTPQSHPFCCLGTLTRYAGITLAVNLTPSPEFERACHSLLRYFLIALVTVSELCPPAGLMLSR